MSLTGKVFEIFWEKEKIKWQWQLVSLFVVSFLQQQISIFESHLFGVIFIWRCLNFVVLDVVNLSQHKPSLTGAKETAFSRHCGKKQKVLVTSIFSFSRCVFYPCKMQESQFQHHSICHLQLAFKLVQFKILLCADNNFRFDEYGRKFSKQIENTAGKAEIARNEQFSFSHSVFKRLVLQTCKNQGLFGKGLRVNQCRQGSWALYHIIFLCRD